jgi:DNA-binding IscR family transcriptional regulator
MTEHPELDDGLWLSVTELAARKGVRKSTISEKVARLVESGLLATKPGKGKAKLINVAQYDLAIGEVGDVARETGAVTKAELADTGTSSRDNAGSAKYRDEATREKAYNADLKLIELEKARGNLLVVAEFDAAAEDAASRIADVVDGLLARDSELTAIAIKEGENGMRAALKRVVRQQRQQIVDVLKEMAVTARARAKAAANDLPLPAEPSLASIAE